MVFSPSPQTAQPTNLSAFVGGINAAAPLFGMPAEDCIYSYNLNANEYGMSVRLGTDEWANGLTGTGVKSILPYNSSTPELFSATNQGIWDITTENVTTPTKVVTFSNVAEGAGQITSINYTNSAATWLLCSDELNGYHTYDGTNWDLIGGIAPVITLPGGLVDVTADIVFVMAWKKRLWFIVDGYSDAYYLPVDAVQGELVLFRLSNKFQQGGAPVGLWSWTIDSGAGVDDLLVALSEEGDCLIYSGIDPSSTEGIALIGSYYVGELPVGRRVAHGFGGDLIVLSTNGILSLSSFLQGTPLETSSNYLTQRIEKLVRESMIGQRNYYGWGLFVSPKDSTLIISTPINGDERPIQFVMNTTTKSWGFWRDIPFVSGATWQDEFYIGSEDTNVFRYSGSVDNANIDGSGGDDIEYSVLSSYLDYGSPATNKVVQYVRPTFRSGSIPSYSSRALYDYDFSEIFYALPAGQGTSGAWQPGIPSSVWDTAVWAGALSSSYSTLGSSGMGRTIAIAIRGNSATVTDLVDVNVMWTSGGMM